MILNELKKEIGIYVNLKLFIIRFFAGRWYNEPETRTRAL